MALQDFSINTSGTPQDVQRRQALADALMKQGSDNSPAAGGRNGGWITAANRAMAGALGGYQQGQLQQDEQSRLQANDAQMAALSTALMGGGQGSTPQAAPMGSLSAAPGAPGPQPQPRPQTAPLAAALSRDDNEAPVGPAPAPGATDGMPRFGPDGKMMGNLTGNIGQPPAPTPEALNIAARPAQIAQGPVPAPQAPQMAATVQQRAGTNPEAVAAAWAVVRNPNATPSAKQIAGAIINQSMTPKDQWSAPFKDGDGNLMVRNSANNEVKMLSAAEKATGNQKDYEYGQTHPGFNEALLARTKAGAANTKIENVGNVGAENKGLSEAAKLDAETVRKGQNEQMPALDDADHNFQIMQDAIDRNGGKLPTGGILGKLGLDARRTSDYIRNNWGVDLGDDPTTATSLETFNKGGIKASGDMAKAIGGNRVLKVEFDMAQKANPGLETTDGGNKYLIDLNRNTIAIKRDHLQAQEDYWRDHNHSLDGFQKSWNAEVKSNPRALSNFSVAPPIKNDDGTQFVKLPSTGQGGYSWFRKGQDGLSPITDQKVASRLENSAKPLQTSPNAPTEKIVGGKTYVRQDGNWFEKPAGAP